MFALTCTSRQRGPPPLKIHLGDMGSAVGCTVGPGGAQSPNTVLCFSGQKIASRCNNLPPRPSARHFSRTKMTSYAGVQLFIAGLVWTGHCCRAVCRFCVHCAVRYEIRDASLTCARKPTRVSLICRTEPTTKKWKTEKLKSQKQICSEVSVNTSGNP